MANRPALNAVFIGGRDFVVLGLEPNGLLGPGGLHNFEDFFKDRPVMRIHFRAIHGCASHMVVLAKHIGPPVLISSGKAGNKAPFGQMIDNGDLFCDPKRVPGG